MTERFQTLNILPAGRPSGDALMLAFSDNQVLVHRDDPQRCPTWDELRWWLPADAALHVVGVWQAVLVHVVAVAASAVQADDWIWVDLRRLLGQVDDDWFAVAGRGAQILAWADTHRFCGRCGTPTGGHPQGERARVCVSCGLSVYPRINPCVIGLVTRGDELLLARAHRFTNGMFSTLAGFMEVGETAEATLVREVREEVGVEISDLRYFGSQSWPFPSNLMLGFHARYAGGELRLQDDEIAEADFFHYTRLPLIPPPGSIARALIDQFVQERRTVHG